MRPLRAIAWLALCAASGCARDGRFPISDGGNGTGDGSGLHDLRMGDGGHLDGSSGKLDGSSNTLDGSTTLPDASQNPDLAPPPDMVMVNGGPITGGPCMSGAPGATAFRIGFDDGAGVATVNYIVDGLPDKTRWKAGAYGYQIGFMPAFVDMFLGKGGLQLDDSDFVDIELSTVGLNNIQSATLSLFGRSYDVQANGSFNWQTFVDTGATPPDLVSNVAPYHWDSGDATSAFAPGDNGALLRIKPGPSSDSLVVNMIELCMEAN